MTDKNIDHIDHKARADELVALSWTAPNDEKAWLLAEAQIATDRALVAAQERANELARIGHLIALLDGDARLAEENRDPMRAEIREGLGLS